MIEINNKKSIKLKNRTKHFVPDKDRTFVQFGSQDTYLSRQSKIEGYETRLYYEFQDCDRQNGQTFFYTLTYNDEHIPTYMGQNCFDYEDLRFILNGGFKKMLYRKYGTDLKYFVGAELGDGKGKRGMHNNPHYHILFFLRPSEKPYTHRVISQVPDGFYSRNSKNHKKGDVKYKNVHTTVTVPYTKIRPEEFRHLVRTYWQGFDEDVDGYQDYRTARYGIAREGENLGKVVDFRACGYVSKYVSKDVALVNHEAKIEQKLRYKYAKQYKDTYMSYADFYHSVIYNLYNVPMNAKHTKWLYDDKGLAYNMVPDLCKRMTLLNDWSDGWIPDVTKQIIKECGLYERYCQFVDEYIGQKVHDDLCDYRNRYCNKCRISQGVGLYALQFVHDKLTEPTIPMPKKKGLKYRPIGMYYYRKLFTEVYTDVNGSPIRILNDDGIQYKLNHYKSSSKKMQQKAYTNLTLMLGNKSLYEKMCASDINSDVYETFDQFSALAGDIAKNADINDILKRYAEFKLVYEDRYFKIPSLGDSDVCRFPDIDVMSDYKRFLQPSVDMVRRSDNAIDVFLENHSEDYLPYLSHPYFLRYYRLFVILDMCADYFFVQKDDKKEDEAKRIAETKRFHNERRLKEFYAPFSR